jgi:hypothetical protein
MAFADKEQFRILFLDKRNHLIADEVQQVGTVDHTPVYPREIVKRALELSATAVILVHNHPSGDPTPSRADIQMTQQIVEVAKPLGISVHDHIIVGKEEHASLKGLRLISRGPHRCPPDAVPEKKSTLDEGCPGIDADHRACAARRRADAYGMRHF